MTYTMKISRLTIDKLGVKLYDKVSAVIAELVSNSYDADATEVIIEAPMGEYLASKAGGTITDKQLQIQVIDNGIGMTPTEINDFYLIVGAERRNDTRKRRGDKSPKYGRSVMGRKGVGKLAPFGICEVIEIITAGGEKVDGHDTDGNIIQGFRTAHFILNIKDILQDTEFDYEPKIGDRDNTLSHSTGTTIILRQFNYRRVPERDLLSRQISQRFGLPTANWRIVARDTTMEPSSEAHDTVVGQFSIDLMEASRIEFRGPDRPNFTTKDDSGFNVNSSKSLNRAHHAGFYHDGKFFPITGWVAYAKKPYKDELMAGIRIYCRGKFAAQTALFNRNAGFTGEYNIRSYLVGEIHADWLDEDEDLIQTDRRDILWSHDLGQAFEEWGKSIVQSVGLLARDPLRRQTWERFAEIGDIKAEVDRAFPAPDQRAIRDNAMVLAKSLGRAISPSELDSSDVVRQMVQLTLTLAPHITLDEKLREAADEASTPLEVIGGILKIARLAELSSFGRIAEVRLKVIQRVQGLKEEGPDTAEQKLQEQIQFAPWLINPQWAPVTANQSFTALKREFEIFYREKTGRKIRLGDFDETRRRPDFVLSSQDNGLQIIEIKKPQHPLTNPEMDRIVTYHDTMRDFLNAPDNVEFRDIFRRFHITLVCDDRSLTGAQEVSYISFLRDKVLTHINWRTFLLRTKKMHEDFLKEAERQKRNIVETQAR